jgi:hypothetical protein
MIYFILFVWGGAGHNLDDKKEAKYLFSQRLPKKASLRGKP